MSSPIRERNAHVRGAECCSDTVVSDPQIRAAVRSVNAVEFIRTMRGGAQAQLLKADDDAFYVVKFVNNPQHRRILINEMITAQFLRYLQITSPEAAIVNLSTEFLAANPKVRIECSDRVIAVPAGLHFGSRFPGDPEFDAVYDYLPDVLLRYVANAREFLGVLALDKWMGNSDSRQCVFVRAHLREWAANGGWGFETDINPRQMGYVALMIDHGFVFNGPDWEFLEGPTFGTYPRKLVYESVRSLEDFEPWLSRILNFEEVVVEHALKQIPPEWMDGDAGRLEGLLAELLLRRKRLRYLLVDCCRAKLTIFPNWCSVPPPN